MFLSVAAFCATDSEKLLLPLQVIFLSHFYSILYYIRLGYATPNRKTKDKSDLNYRGVVSFGITEIWK